MKTLSVKLRRLLFTLTLFTCLCALSGRSSAAAVECILTKPATTYLFSLQPQGTLKGSIKVTGANYAKVKAGYSKQYKHSLLKITPKKTGTVKVKYTCVKNGRQKSYTQAFKIVAHVNPAASFKIGRTEYAGKFNKTGRFTVKKKLSGKLNIKPADEWEISNISFVKASGDGVSVKNGKK